MRITVHADAAALGAAAATEVAQAIVEAVQARGRARIIVATGASQFTFLDALVARTDVPWAQVDAFHLDEYLGLPLSHPASFRKYLQERLFSRVPIGSAYLLDGEGDPSQVLAAASAAISAAPIDLCCCGIGENGHLAFNDPPADFVTDQPYLVVNLDEACRRQQVGEGWFAGLDDVPAQALSMSVRQIMRSRQIFCMVPDERKSVAVQASLEGPVTSDVPASILQTHPNMRLFLDPASASRLEAGTITAGS
ncbi:Glucosamine-6-phosphate deaminase [Luteitalea pratensis]|uniref:Glucosamine-6-phosphate deaminase n=1 Tax=Luteitalea pratensis TaxID=1855912 RepID=A0A143PRQ4_LUTPR|nr:glucosamine-6-phosphate deaminase [Luteitalea pratensis]AMY11285.1 Glucosamine-6-phosphate deaminase [Luteitalea pratensis]